MALKDEFGMRKEKLERLRSYGVDPYPARVERDASIQNVLSHFDVWKDQGKRVTIVGRIMITRIHGKMAFADVRDASGTIQVQFTEDRVGKESYDRFIDCIDPADFVQIQGTLFLTQRGQQTVAVEDWHILVKALRPLPEKWHGLVDTEQRFRKRYLDLIMNEEVKERMVKRSLIISAIRSFLDARGFLEVETPTLQPVYGGGFARPFITHHNALDEDYYLRISDEMYLKRLLVGGFEKVYEITKVFRNEGIDRDHNPEFTMFEAQVAYEDYRYGMDLFEEIFEHAALEALGTTDVLHGEVTISLKRPWKRMTVTEAVRYIGGLDVSGWSHVQEAGDGLRPLIRNEKHEELSRLQSVGEIIAFAFEELVEEKLIQPTIIYDYPIEVSPLAKKASDPRYVERFEAFAMGSEVGNNYTELNDPIDLERRFIEEKRKEEAGFEEAHQTDTAYLEAIEHGMPPACGLGIGVDRMVMLLTGAPNLKEVILFPTLRPDR